MGKVARYGGAALASALRRVKEKQRWKDYLSPVWVGSLHLGTEWRYQSSVLGGVTLSESL